MNNIETNKIPTAEEFLHLKYFERYNNVKEGQIYPTQPTTEAIQDAIEFAKLHVQAALEAAAERANEIPSAYSYRNTILNSYNYDNIK